MYPPGVPSSSVFCFVPSAVTPDTPKLQEAPNLYGILLLRVPRGDMCERQRTVNGPLRRIYMNLTL